MNIIDIVLILIFVIIIFKLITPTVNEISSIPEKKQYKRHHKSHSNKKHFTKFLGDYIVQNTTVNPYIINVKFHTDYRDIQTAFNNIVPTQKQIFNIMNIPITYNKISAKLVSDLVSDFIVELNNSLKHVSTYRTENSGWDEAIQDKPIQSGWDKMQIKLGLQPSIYPEPATKSVVKLIKIVNAEEYKTDNEIKYTVYAIIQKENVDDQMLLKINFVKQNFNSNDIIIEELDIQGFLSTVGEENERFDSNDFYDFSKMESQYMLDNKKIASVLLDKYKQRLDEKNRRIAMLDEEAQETYRHPNDDESNSYQVTRTIHDDFMDNPF